MSEFIAKDSKKWMMDCDASDHRRFVEKQFKQLKENDTIKSIEERIVKFSNQLVDRRVEEIYESMLPNAIEQRLKYEDNLFLK